MSLRHLLQSGTRLLPLQLLLLVLLPFAGSHAGLRAQTAELRVEENLRAEPNGTVLGQLAPGTRVTVEEAEGSWSRATLHGFVWTPSLQIRREQGFDLVVSAAGGENLREEPGGRVAGRLETGVLLEEVARIPGWVEVRRTGWIWSPSLAMGADTNGDVSDGDESPESAEETAGSASAGGWLRSRGQELPVLSAPGGDTLGRAQPAADLRVIAREGNWARVQLDGWVWVPSTAGSDEEGAVGESSVVADVTPLDLAADPEGHRNRLIQLDVQFISLERAEQVRTDFYEGEPFLLTRALTEDRSFVYVAVPPERLEEMRMLAPLERIRIVARVRSGAAALTGSPVVELMELDRER